MKRLRNKKKVPCIKPWEALRTDTELNNNYINILIKLYIGSRAHVKTDFGITRLFELLKGVKQGDILSALLFCVALMVIMRRTLEDCNFGIRIGGEIYDNFGYADDLSLLAESIKEMETFLSKLIKNADEFGLQLNYSKTKFMLIGPIRNTINHLKVHGMDIERVTKFTYLGRILCEDGNDEAEVQNRITNGWIAFNKRKGTITSKRLSMKTKRKTYENYILPVVLHGTETVTWSPKLINKMKTFENHIMRWMCNTRLIERVSIQSLRSKTKLPCIEKKIKTRKLKYFGHVKRSRLPIKHVFEGMVQGTRRRGAPKRRWRKDIQEWTNLSLDQLNSAVRHRDDWRSLCHNVT